MMPQKQIAGPKNNGDFMMWKLGGKKKSCPVNRDYCFVYDFTKQTSLYLFETKVSHQSAVSISHLTILHLKHAIWIPVATSPHPPQ